MNSLLIESKQQISVISDQSICRVCDVYCNNQQFSYSVIIRKTLFQKQTKYYGKYKKIIQNIIYGYQSKFTIEYKQSLVCMFDKKIPQFKYKKFDQICLQIKDSIMANISSHKKDKFSNRLYFGQNISNIMICNQLRKKNLGTNKINIAVQNNTYKHLNKFKVKNLESLSTDSEQKILNPFELQKKYDFLSLEDLQKPSKIESSIIQIAKLKRSISIMVNEIKIDNEVYLNLKDFNKPFVQWPISNKQLKFRKKLELTISEIYQFKQNQKNTRLYTELESNKQIDQNIDSEAYGMLFNNIEIKKKKKKQLMHFVTKQIMLSRDKSANKLSKNKILSCRQNTEPSGTIISTSQKFNGTMNIWNNEVKKSKSKSKSRLKITSPKNRLNLLNLPTSNQKLITKVKSDKSLNKSKKLVKNKT